MCCLDLFTIKEIDGVSHTISPQQKELNKIGKKWGEKFKEFDARKIEKFSNLIGGEREKLKIGERWAVRKKFFPGVKVHFSFHYHGEEFDSYGKNQIRFLFSGKNVKDVTGEDLLLMIESTLNFAGRLFSKNYSTFEGKWKENINIYKARREGLEKLNWNNKDEIERLANFIESKWKYTNSSVLFSKEFFPKLFLKLKFGENFDTSFCGERAKTMTGNELGNLAILVLNHIIRFITKNRPSSEIPKICEKVFPRDI